MIRKSQDITNYHPQLVKLLIKRLEAVNQKILLTGFSETMKWLARILSEQKKEFCLFDWREEYIGYDCCGKSVYPTECMSEEDDSVIVICIDEFNSVCEVIHHLVKSKFSHIPVIIESTILFSPNQIQPYENIYKRAEKRATSLNSDSKIFNLIQLLRETKDIKGDIVEFGSFSGGTASFIVESLKEWEIEKNVWLMDSYCGLPESTLGVDARWKNQFLNVSLSEVKNNFVDCSHVSVVNGNIKETINAIDFPISLVHIDVDTYEGARIAAEKTWSLLSNGGVMLFDDYGYLPNCYPLTAFVDEFVKKLRSSFKFTLPSGGLFLIKNESS